MQSLKLSDEESGLDEVASQVITSSGEEEDEETQQGQSSSFPELVMPSLQMPTRRPFTDKGRAMGKLKVLVAGESGKSHIAQYTLFVRRSDMNIRVNVIVGVGKTSFIRSILQLCEDIVHVDNLSASQTFPQSPPPPKSKSRKRKHSNMSTSSITEIHASTKTYPHWWTELEESRTRKRKSIGDAVLERNLCFIDTPGYGAASVVEDQNSVVNYVESLLYQNASVASMDDSDIIGIIGGNGGVQVDVIFYLLSPGKTSESGMVG